MRRRRRLQLQKNEFLSGEIFHKGQTVNKKAFDGQLTKNYTNRFAGSVERLLADHVRKAFLEDEQAHQALRQRIDQLQANFRAAESKLKQSAVISLEKIQARLDRLAADDECSSAEGRKLEAERNDIAYFLDRGNSGNWSDLERRAANSSVDTALANAAQKISMCETQIETLSIKYERVIQDEKTWASHKQAAEELLSSLNSGGEPMPYQSALNKEITDLNSAFKSTSTKAQLELVEKRNVHTSDRNALSRLEKELADARLYEEKLASAKNFERLILLSDPRNFFRRRADDIQKHYEKQQNRVQEVWSEVTSLSAKIDDLGRQRDQSLNLLPGLVREKITEKTQGALSNASTSLAEIVRLSGEVKVALESENANLASIKSLYAAEHQRQLDAHFAEALRQGERNLQQLDARIVTLTERRNRIEVIRASLLRIAEKRREKLEGDLQDARRHEAAQIAPYEREINEFRLRLQDRAPRAGLVYDSATNSFREQDAHWNSVQKVSFSYRRASGTPTSIATLPVLLQRREQTGYVSKDDERLANFLASVLGDDEPVENERPVLIDRFCDIVFGDSDESRNFFISIISEHNNGVLVLVRPAQVLPQLKSRLPEAMSVSVLCRLEHGARKTPDNTTLFLLDTAVVPDCEPRPFERTVALVRHASPDRLPLASPSLADLLVRTNPAAKLLDGLQDRLADWQGYLDWANDVTLQRSPWAVLGNGEWKNKKWEGVILCRDKSNADRLARERKTGEFRRSIEVYLLNDQWQQRGLESDKRVFRCNEFQLLSKQIDFDTPEACPWPNIFPCLVRLEFGDFDANALADLPEATPLGVRDMTDAVGSRSQIKRYSTALQQLQTVFFDRDPAKKKSIFSNRLSSAPYLMASVFNVSQAAVRTTKPGRLLNADLAKLYRLNVDQAAAVEVMLAAPEVAYIQGPPGTGKTTMIAAACAHFVRSGQRVLVASQTNLAVENALERLIGDPEVRPLWLSKNEIEEKKSTAVADWYRMAADHSENSVCNPFRDLAAAVGRMKNWLERAKRLNKTQYESTQELRGFESALQGAQATLESMHRKQEARSVLQARVAWWAMARVSLEKLNEWNPACFSPELANDAAKLLTILAEYDSRTPRLDVSPGALHRQAQERIQNLQLRLSSNSESSTREDAERTRAQILGSWPDMYTLGEDGIDENASDPLTVAQAETAVLRGEQALEDARSRSSDIELKVATLMSEIGSHIDLAEIPKDLGFAVELVERHLSLHQARLSDVEPIREWLPLLEQWTVDLRHNAENPPAADRMGEGYVNSANVIGITCNADFKILSDNGSSRFDVVIIDEVSKATPLELLRPMLLAPKAILVGDHRQLPPTFEFASPGSNGKSTTEDEDPDALNREAELLSKYAQLNTASLFRKGFSEIDSGSRAMLYTQYRMHPQIMDLVNRFYDGRLKSGLIDPDGLDDAVEWSWRTHGLSLSSRTGGQYLTPKLHTLWVDSSKDENDRIAVEKFVESGFENQLEARLVAQIVEDIADACEKDHRKKTIAVPTFYNRQKILIRKKLEEKLGRRLANIQIDVETVDRFQGKEADIVIVSMVRNRSAELGRLGRNSNPAKFERINVAFSRARDLLIVVGARDTFEKFEVAIEPVDGGPPKRTCVYGQIIGDIRDAGGLWQAKDILGTSSNPHQGRRK